MRVRLLFGALLFVGITTAVAAAARSVLDRDAQRERELDDWVQVSPAEN